MALNANSRTLFHLVPANDAARDALLHPDNARFVSTSATEVQGLEVGFHVPSMPRGRVITRLGRDADLVLRGRSVSAVHVAFEIHPETLVVLLSVRSKYASQRQTIKGDCVVVYGTKYTISIASFNFLLTWRDGGTVDTLRQLAAEGYQNSLQLLRTIRSRDLPTEFDDSELHSWHNTRLHTARRVLFREAEGAPRLPIGQGQFGDVYRAVDLESGHPFAVKVIKLEAYGAAEVEQARAHLHREIKALQYLNHKNIIECLGTAKFDTGFPEIFMPLRPGSLKTLAAQGKEKRCNDDDLCMQVLEQMLSALDYLADRGMCHRDVKPDNILYYEQPSKGTYMYTFQLADFGLVNHQQNAVTFCGTPYDQAPELFHNYGQAGAQSPKMDVWSLFATAIDVHPKFTFPPRDAKSYHDILLAVRAAVPLIPELADMAREDPLQRASAAQLLVAHFDGRGLTTRRAAVPLIPPPPSAQQERMAMSIDGDQSRADAVPTPAQAPAPAPRLRRAAKASPLVVYDSRHRRQQGKDPSAGPSNPLAAVRPQKPRPPPSPTVARQGGGIAKVRSPATGSPARQRIADTADIELWGGGGRGRVFPIPSRFPSRFYA
ncbi:kinase-like domain-containing protein [Parachaetomium inaequale]|uniref:mitogen-activated protein kinase n=1 Tax=Parachaetomium inaequale TaxID=2588326 RepID=A0AAN6SMS1_9PEZI|nr:kinase-like domain-containing protein [Parachaetomium inaequale]